MKREGLRIIIAGGGTGGHLFPGIALAETFREREPLSEVLFVGTRRGLEARVLGPLGYALRTLDVEGIKGRGGLRALRAALKVPGSLGQAWVIIREFSPHLVIGVGGYASGPAVLAAVLMGIPTAVAEQNAVPGATNRILGKVVDRVFLSFPDREGTFPPRKVLVTGNPVRRSFLRAFDETPRRREGEVFTVLVFGGSQGARAINRAVTESLDHLGVLKGRLRFVHQTGEQDLAFVEEAYRRHGFEARVLPFIMDMADAFLEADLLVCRAGATTVAEITLAGKAAILIPFPHAVGDHQTKNASVLAAAGAAILIPEAALRPADLAGTITALATDPKRLEEMEKRAKELGNINAGDDIVSACFDLLRKRGSWG